ncbi:MAG: HEPN domain-containing protein [Candidatus Magasanikbacteria bacterium]|nr:HEPN domain-containing protein [Candidatus Magasanikbacteria bacterium]
MTKKELLKNQIVYWRSSAKKDWKTAKYLFLGKYYDACLFFCHLAIEKLLKGMVVIETKDTPPFIHQLVRLATLACIEYSDEEESKLKLITTFHIAGRYKEDKLAFYKKCTPAFTKKNLVLCKEVFVWLEKEYQKKLSKR